MDIKALVVDNNPVLLRAVSAILAQEGCIVQTAGTGLEAIEIADDFCPDIVFTDLIMPMVSGEQLCRILRNTKKHEGVFIVVLSAIVLEDRARILRDVHCDMCIAKGNLREIRQHIRDAIEAFNQRSVRIRDNAIKATRIPDGLKPSGLTSELLLEKRHLSEILANLEEGIIELNYQGKVVAANNSALAILSLKEEEIVGRALPEAVNWSKFSEDIRQWNEQQLTASGMEKYDIFENDPLVINETVITASFIPISESGSLFGLCILRDITRQFKAEKYHKELDNALRLVKKMDAMSCMAGGFAHDFNNLLTVICGNLDIVTMGGQDHSGDDPRKLLHEAKNAALAAVDLTRQISCFSNFGILSRKNVQVEPLVRQTVDHFFSGHSDQYKIRGTCQDGSIQVDPKEISLAIGNVLQNAREASAGQEIEIVIGENDFAAPKLLSGQYLPAGKYVRIDIRDCGGGINSEQLFRIFDPYYSTKERGTSKGMGLGLTLVYAILRNHGGYVVVCSKPKEGTMVSLYLPVQKESRMFLLPETAAADNFVLLIEPEQQMAEIGKIMLTYLGFSVKVAADRAGAIAELRQFTDNPLLPRPLVILALTDAKGESAVETCRLLHEVDPQLKVIAMSGTILGPVMENCQKYGFTNTLPKPFSMDSLKHITNTVLQS